jgi:hypothetical protein
MLEIDIVAYKLGPISLDKRLSHQEGVNQRMVKPHIKYKRVFKLEDEHTKSTKIEAG